MKADFDTFKINRNFRCTPDQLFAAWADPSAKATWFTGPPGKWVQTERSLDFREGGAEIMKGVFDGSMLTAYIAHYYDIVENSRITHSFEVRLDGAIYSVSTAVVEFSEDSGGTRMEFTEQICYLDGDRAAEATPGRIQGTNEHFDRLETYLG